MLGAVPEQNAIWKKNNATGGGYRTAYQGAPPERSSHHWTLTRVPWDVSLDWCLKSYYPRIPPSPPLPQYIWKTCFSKTSKMLSATNHMFFVLHGTNKPCFLSWSTRHMFFVCIWQQKTSVLCHKGSDKWACPTSQKTCFLFRCHQETLLLSYGIQKTCFYSIFYWPGARPPQNTRIIGFNDFRLPVQRNFPKYPPLRGAPPR